MEKCIYNLQLGIRFQIVKKINIEKILLTQMMCDKNINLPERGYNIIVV